MSNYLNILFFLFSSIMLFSTSAHTKVKKTVGELLSQVSLQNRGGKLSQSQKRKSQIPKAENIEILRNYQEHNLENIKPVKSYEIIKSENIPQIAEYEGLLDQQIQELYKLTTKFKDSNNRGELWLRLAELYVEKGTLIDYRRQKEFDKKLELYNQKKIKSKPELETEEAKSYFKKSVQLYEWFEKDFPRDPKIPQALYFLGYNHFELGQPQRGEVYYTKLAENYPNSSFVDEANFALGEYYFDNEKWKMAYKYYSPVIKNKRHNLNAMATYKGAWCLYRLGRNRDALKYMEHIIKLSRESNDKGQLKQAKAKLEVEALKDVIVFYAAAGESGNAVEYFDRLVGKQSLAYVERLAYFYMDKGYKESAHQTFQYLISKNPTSPKAFEYQYQIVQIYFYSKNSPVFKKELYQWIKDYGPSSAWYQANQNNQELIDNSMKLREKTLRNWTLQQHQTAQNSRTKNSQNLALEGYTLYLTEFINFPQSSDMHFYYGELLYDMKRFDEAGVQYKWIVDNAPQSKYYENSASNLLIAVEKSLPEDKELSEKSSKNLEPIPFSPTVDRFLKASSWYLEKLPNSKKAPEIKFRRARILYQHNYFGDASKSFREIVKSYPKTKYAEYSANLLLDIYNLKKDYAGLELAAGELLKDETLAGTKAGIEIKDVLEKASFKKAQDLEKEQKYLESADMFSNFAQQNSKSELVGTALYNAGVNYEKSGNNEKAKNSYLAVVNSDKAKRELKYKSKLFVAKLYQEASLFDESIKLFKQLIREDEKNPQNKNYLYNVAVMYEAQGNYLQAIREYEKYFDEVKRWQEKLELIFTLAELYRKSNQLSRAQAKYKEYIDNNPSDAEKLIESYYWMGEIYDMKGSSQSYSWQDKLIAVYKKLSSSRKNLEIKWVAKTRLKKAKESYQEFKEIKIPSQPEKQKKAVDEKISLLNKLNKELNEIVKLGSPLETVSSLTLLGDANNNMAQSILNSPIPKGLGPELEKQYKDSLPKLAEPFVNRASEGHKLAVERGIEFEAYNDDYERSYKYMQNIDPKKYYKSDEIKFDVRFINWMAI